MHFRLPGRKKAATQAGSGFGCFMLLNYSRVEKCLMVRTI